MTEPERLFAELRDLNRIRRAVDENEQETVHLEFKTVHGLDSKLTDGHKNTICKAVGALANAKGGVIVWGIDSKQRGEVRVANRLEPISDLIKFHDQLMRFQPTRIAIPGLDHILVPLEDNKGFVVTLVPESPVKPRMASNDIYYYRSNDNSFAMDEQMVRGMILARATPELELVWAHQFRKTSRDDDAGCFIGHVHVHGHVPVEDLAIAAAGLPLDKVSINFPSGMGSRNTMLKDEEQQLRGEFCKHAESIVYPGMILPAVRLNFLFKGDRPKEHHALVKLYARGFAAEYRLDLTPAVIMELPLAPHDVAARLVY